MKEKKHKSQKNEHTVLEWSIKITTIFKTDAPYFQQQQHFSTFTNQAG